MPELRLGPGVFLLVGLLLAFFGRALVVFQLALLGALFGAAVASGLLMVALAAGWTPPPDLPLDVVRIVALVVGALGGWWLAGLLRRAALFLLGGAAGATALTQVAATWPELLPAAVAAPVGAVLGGVLLLALEGPLLKLGTAVLGGLLVASALTALLPGEYTALAPLGGLTAGGIGAVTQLAPRRAAS